MSLCACCGERVGDGGDLCGYHVLGDGSDWATGNRILCDFVHRGIVPPTPREVICPSIDVLRTELILAA